MNGDGFDSETIIVAARVKHELRILAAASIELAESESWDLTAKYCSVSRFESVFSNSTQSISLYLRFST